MDSFEFSLLMSYSILIPALIGIFRFTSIHSDDKPLLAIIWLGALNDLLSILFIYRHNSNTVNGNIYVLIEALLFTFMFYRWKRFSFQRFLLLTSLLTAVWFIDNLILHTLATTNSGFRVLASFVLGFFAVSMINNLLLQRIQIFKHGRFLLCLGMLLLYSYKAFAEVFYSIPFQMTPRFYQNVFGVLVVMNFIANLLYAFAVLCLPKKPAYILRS
jgi:hypothetical protein